MSAEKNMGTGRKALLFIFIGIPSLFVFLGSLFLLLAEFIKPEGMSYIRVTLLILGIPMGAIAILVGVGELRRWMYFLVFFSFPLSFLLLGVFAERLYLGLVFILISSGMVYLIVKRHYTDSK